MADITANTEAQNTQTAQENTAPEATATVDTAALQAELERLRSENGRLKSAQSNASADAAKYKRALSERMSEQERAANETKELIEQLKADNAQLKRSQAVAEQRANFIGIGFESGIAEKAANAAYDSDFAALTSAIKDFLTAHDKAIQADVVRSTPRPGTGGADKPSITREQFDKMGYTERAKLFEEQPETYAELTKEV